jgi:hypothetical protein
LTVEQKNRRDAEHLRILIPCVRGFLREFLEQVENGQLPIKGWLGAIKQIIKIGTSPRGRKAAKRFGVHWSGILPVEEVAKSRHEKVVRFRENQLARLQW